MCDSLQLYRLPPCIYVHCMVCYLSTEHQGFIQRKRTGRAFDQAGRFVGRARALWVVH